jgi:hypothetical protein
VKRLAAALAATSIALVTALVPSAGAATEFGDDCPATAGELGYTVLPLARTSPSSLSLTAPSNGVLTWWTVRIAPGFPIEAEPVRLLVFRATGNSGEFELAGESADSGAGQPAFTTRTRIPVKAGDRLGLYSPGDSGTPVCGGGEAGDELGFLAGAAGPGSNHLFAPRTGFRLPVSARLEPDRDGDGYGDETQDACPQSAAYSGACPRFRLSIVGATVRTRSIVLRVRASAEATVRVLGQVGWGFQSSRKPLPGHDPPTRLIIALRGGTKTVAPGKATRFRVKLPRAVLRRLDRIAPPQELKAKLTASASQLDGVVEKAHLTVHLKGRDAG